MLPPLTDRLAIYLNDHLAGATIGLELARRAAANNRSTNYGPPLAELAEEIERDRDALLEIMARLSVGRDMLRVLAAWGAEKLGRLKLNGELLGYSPLSRLEELEMLSLGVEGKLALWQTLRRALAGEPRLDGVDLPALIERARAQRRALERTRRRAADESLS